MKYDFHVHTAERSRCATALQFEQIQAAIRQGLNGIAITDHHRLVPPDELVELNKRYAPFQILPGIEITAEHEDWLVLGMSDPNLERDNWKYSDLHTYVRSKGGVIILAHPFRYHPHISVDIQRQTPDGIEIRSVNIRSDSVTRIQDLAAQLQIPTLCNSDAHSTQAIGKYFNIFDQPTGSNAQVLSLLKSGTFRILGK